MGNVRSAPAWLQGQRIDRLLQALDDADGRDRLRAIGLTDAEIDQVTAIGRDIGVGAVDAAREIIRCSIAVMEGRFS